MKQKILIVEDDQNYRYAIRKSVPWEEAGFEIAGEAIHGKQALEFLARNSADILLTDMDMPLMNGVELIREVRRKYPDILVFVLSAYDDFAFVRESLKLGAEDYILKQDMDGGVILKTIRESLQKRQAGKEKLQEKEQYRKELREWLTGAQKASGAGKSYFDSLFRGKNLFVVYFPAGIGGGAFEKMVTQFFLYHFRSEKGIAAIGDAGSKSCSLARDRIRGRLEKMEEYISQPVYAGCSDVGTGLKELPKLYREAKEALFYQGFTGTGSTVFYWNCETELKQRQPEYRADASVLAEYASRGRNGLEALQKLLVEVLPDERSLNENLLNFYRSFLKIHAGGKEDVYFLDACERVLKERGLARKISVLEESMDGVLLENGHGIHSEILRAKAYIREHYKEEITLGMLAEQASLSENYFSNLFKSETGETVVHYVNCVRIEAAKDLLANTSMKMYEVAHAVGYRNPTYFSTIFKKITGKGVSEYKRQG